MFTAKVSKIFVRNLSEMHKKASKIKQTEKKLSKNLTSKFIEFNVLQLQKKTARKINNEIFINFIQVAKYWTIISTCPSSCPP